MNLGGRNKIVVIAAGAIIVVALVVILFVMKGGKGAEEGAPASGGFAQGTGEAGAGGAGAPASGMGAPGSPGGGAKRPIGMGAAAVAGTGAEAAGGGAYPSVGVVKMGIGPTEPSRIDPFETFNPPVTAPPPEVMVSLPAVGLVQGGLRPGGLTGVAKVGSRRVAGLFFGDKVYAVLEDEDRKTYLVKPGDVVQGIRIIAISRDSIFIRDRDGNRWEVPLRGMEPTTASGSADNPAELSQSPPA
jgi:hypothetical protein